MMMKYSQKRFMALILIFILLFTQILVFSPVQASAAAADSFDLKKLVQAADETSNQILASGIDHFEEAVGVAVSGKQLPVSYVSQLKQTVTDEVYNVVEQGASPNSATHYAGLLLQLKSVQENPQNVNGYDFVQFITNRTDVKNTVLNAAYVLISLDSGNYSVTGLEAFKTDLVQYILSKQHPNAGWDYLGYGATGWDGNLTSPTVDETGMVMTALAPYNNDVNVQNAITKAANWLSTQVNIRGGATGWDGNDSPSSISQLIIGLVSNDINPTIDQRFVKTNGNPVSNLLSLYSGSGHFGQNDVFGTRQGLQALLAYKLLLEDKGTLYGQLKNPSVSTHKLDKVIEIIGSVSNTMSNIASPNWEEVTGMTMAGKGLSANQLTELKNSVNGVAQNGTQATAFAAEILKVKASGNNPESFENVDLVHLLSQRNDLHALVNNATYSLLALNSGDYNISNLQTLRTALKNTILSAQHPGAGWDYSGYGELDWMGNPTTSEVDMTGMVITALAPYHNEPAVQTAIQEAVTWLATQINASGGVTGWDGADSPSSISQVIMGLTANNIDPFKDPRFQQGNNNPISNLISLYNGQGGFGTNDPFGTRQGLQALLSYQFFLENKGSFFVVLEQVAPPQDNTGGGGTPGQIPGDNDTTQKTITVTVKGLNGTTMHNQTVTVTGPATPYSVLVLAMGSNKVSVTGSGSTVYIRGIDGLAEFDHGSGSGWNYSVNGQFPGAGAGAYLLQTGDQVQFLYTLNLGSDVGAGGSSPIVQPPVANTADKVLENFTEISYNNTKPIHEVKKTVVVENANSLMSLTQMRELFQLLQNNVVKESKNVPTNETTTITDAANEIALLIPENALNEAVTIDVEELRDLTKNELVSPIYQFGPAGTKFNKPVLISIKVSFENVELDQLALVWLNEETNQWIPIPATVDAKTGIVTGVVDHFTKFAVVDRAKLDTAAETLQVDKEISNAVQYLLNDAAFTEWEAFAIARSNERVPAQYLTQIEQILKENNGDFRKITDYERIAIAAKALGGNPTNVIGYDLMEKIYNNDRMLNQGINGPIFALIAMNFGQYSIPSEAEWTEEKLLKEIIDSQNADGGFSLASGVPSNADITAMAITALSDYMDREDVTTALEKAVQWLSDHQLENGGYREDGVESSESVAQTIIALTSIGTDPRSERFAKENGDLISNLLSFQNQDGGFSNLSGQASDQIASEQGLMALIAYDRFVKAEAKLFSLGEVNQNNEKFLDDSQIAAYAYSSVYKMKEIGIMQGVSETSLRFAPKDAFTRAQLVKVILELLDVKSDDSLSTSFKDVGTNAWYYGYVAKAEQLGLVAGTSKGRFEPNAIVTREQMAIIVQRVLQLEMSEQEIDHQFKDIKHLPLESQEAIDALNEHKLLIGYQGNFDPKGIVIREMAAVVGYRIYQHLLEQR